MYPLRNQADLVSLIQQGLLISAVSQWKRYINERGAFFEERRSILKVFEIEGCFYFWGATIYNVFVFFLSYFAADIAGYLSLQARFSQLVKQVEQLSHSITAVVQPVTTPTRSVTTPTRPVATPLTPQAPLYTMDTVREMAVKLKALLHM